MLSVFSFRSAKNILLACANALALASCTVGPDYLRPEAPTETHFKELAGWKHAVPRDGIDRGAWWSIYRDPELSRLLPQVAIDNQTVAAALAAYEQAFSLVRESQASLFPQVGANYSVTRSGEGARVLSTGGSGTSSLGTNTSHAFARTDFYPNGTLSWTVDIWGKIRRQIESNVATAQA
ncbi:MAG: RND transporter, partial [Rhodoblastus sp.]